MNLPQEAIADWRQTIARHVERVSAAQLQLEKTLSIDRAALVSADMPAMQACVAEMNAVADELAALESERQQILSRAKQVGLGSESLTALLVSLGLELGKVSEVKERAKKLDRQTHALRIVARQSQVHYAELGRVIYSRGRTPDTYADPNGSFESGGGNFLDAAA